MLHLNGHFFTSRMTGLQLDSSYYLNFHQCLIAATCYAGVDAHRAILYNNRTIYIVNRTMEANCLREAAA